MSNGDICTVCKERPAERGVFCLECILRVADSRITEQERKEALAQLNRTKKGDDHG